MRESIIREKSYRFALEILKLYRSLLGKNEYVLSRQIVRAGTSIGANVEEALAGQSRRDFLAKMSIASKEARECNYWLRLLRDGGFIKGEEIELLIKESEEIMKILTSIVKTTSTKNSKLKINNSEK